MRAFVNRWIASWSGIWFAGFIGCGGLAEDGRSRLGSTADEPELNTARVVTEASASAQIDQPPEPDPSSERRTLAAPSRVGQACGPLREETESLVVGDVELQHDARCGAGSACLMRAPVGSECRGSLSSSAGDCAADGFDLVPVPPLVAPQAAWQEGICTCRCEGSARDTEYCSCPGGMRCAPLIQSAGANAAAHGYVGSYCVF
jgi:hypothetical protein